MILLGISWMILKTFCPLFCFLFNQEEFGFSWLLKGCLVDICFPCIYTFLCLMFKLICIIECKQSCIASRPAHATFLL